MRRSDWPLWTRWPREILRAKRRGCHLWVFLPLLQKRFSTGKLQGRAVVERPGEERHTCRAPGLRFNEFVDKRAGLEWAACTSAHARRDLTARGSAGPVAAVKGCGASPGESN